jgi:ribosome-binding protein aMBF1 (putative translation factor)
VGKATPTPTSTKRTKVPAVLRARTAAPRQKRIKPPPRDPVAAAIVRARTTAGLTQDQLARRLKTHQGNIARLERHTHATVRTLAADRGGHRSSVRYRLPEMTNHGPRRNRMEAII